MAAFERTEGDVFDFIRGHRPSVYFAATGVIFTVVFAAVWVYGQLSRGEGGDADGLLLVPVWGFGLACLLFSPYYLGVRVVQPIFYDLLAMLGPGPRRRPPQDAEQLTAADMERRAVAAGQELGFGVSSSGVWRSGRLVVVVAVKPADALADNDLPASIAERRAIGEIEPDDAVRSFYVVAAWTDAMQELFEAIVEDSKAAEQPRMIALETLEELAEQTASGELSHDEACAIVFADRPVGITAEAGGG